MQRADVVRPHTAVDLNVHCLGQQAAKLKGEPAPEWMEKGIPFVNKGRDQLAPAPNAATSAAGAQTSQVPPR